MRPKSPIGVVLLLSVAVLFFLIQAWFLRELRHDPVTPPARYLETFPSTAGRWKCVGAVPAEPELLRTLRADQILSRNYKEEQTGVTTNLLVAYYRSQRAVHQQYDFEEYLADQGWSRQYATTVQLLPRAGRKVPIRYELFLRGPERRLVLRWFETGDRVAAGGQELHLYRMIDAITGHRTDLARIQIVTPVSGDRPEQASQSTLEFARQVVNVTTAFLSRP